ncbi:MAG: calcium-translocating P-type ATPase, PMCA-type, partial [Butyricicoccaceae bacterium]
AVFLATFVSTLSEYGSDAAFRRMQAQAQTATCRVRRAGLMKEIPFAEVVVGDLVYLQAGESIPADGVLAEGSLSVDQSALTGESAEVEKEQEAQLYRDSIVMSGEGLMEVRRVGDETVYGGMARQIQEEPRPSPLHVRLEALANAISRFGIAAAVLVAAADLMQSFVLGSDVVGAQAIASHLLHAATLAVTVVVVAVPEGLPMMITIVLSRNMFRMMKDHVLVRRLTGIETAGSLSILFTDKTGTLTQGKMSVNTYFAPDGAAYHTAGELRRMDPERYELLELFCTCGTGAQRSEGTAVGGNATDRALLNFVPHGYAVPQGEYLPFDSGRKYSAVHIPSRGITLVKGAPDVLLPHCRNAASMRRLVKTQSEAGERVIALATTRHSVRDGLSDLTCAGLLCLSDPIRQETPQAVRDLRDAGIQLVMVTGDSRATAEAIAKRAGMLSGDAREILESHDMARLSDEELRTRLPHLRVVARALPQDKSRLVRLAQERGLVAGMTGDGINDAPALKKADVGFAMGSGTAVAREAGDIVITDDNLASIVRAVLYGRTIFHSIQRFLVFQLTLNLCAVGVSVAGPLIGIDTPVTVMQMLWINLIMDTLAGIAFAGEPPLPVYLHEAPKRREESVLNREMAGQIAWVGGYTIALCVVFLRHPAARAWFRYEQEPIVFLTAFFALMIFCGVFHSFNARTERMNLIANLSKNPAFLLVMLAVTLIQLVLIYFGGALFRTSGLRGDELTAVVLLAFTVIPVDLARKWLGKRIRR